MILPQDRNLPSSMRICVQLYGVAFSLDGNMVATTGARRRETLGYRRTRRSDALQEKGRLQGHLAGIGHVAYSPDHKLLATASHRAKSGVVILWDVHLLQTRAILRDTNVCAFSPDGQTLVTGEGENVNGELIPKLEQWDIDDLIKPEVLARQTKEAAVEFLEAVRDSGFERAAGDALAAIVGQEAALPVLRDGLDDPDPEVRKGIVFALQKIGPKAIPILEKALEDADPKVRRAAAANLRIMTGVEANR
jgi:hypothetical protein